jgi:hypothetical protein
MRSSRESTTELRVRFRSGEQTKPKVIDPASGRFRLATSARRGFAGGGSA